MSESKHEGGHAHHLAEIGRLLGDSGADVVHAPTAIPSIATDPGVVEALRKADGIAAELRKAEADFAELVGDEHEGGDRRGLLPRKITRNPDEARIHAEAAELLGDAAAKVTLDRLNRLAEIQRRLPVLRSAKAMADKSYDEAAHRARQKLFPVGAKIFTPALRAAVRGYLRGLVQLQAASDLYHRLDVARIADGINGNPLHRSFPAHAHRHGGLPELLIALSRHGLTWSDIETAAPELIAAGHLTEGDRVYFANG